MSVHRPGTQIYFISNSMFQCGSSFRGFLEFYRIKKVVSKGKFEICWWVHQRGRHVEMGALSYRPMLTIVLALGLVEASVLS